MLNKRSKKEGHIVYNLGMTGKENEHNLTYVQLGLMAALLINTKSVDFVVTGLWYWSWSNASTK